jgi:4-nitrophenyl phosphatase
MAAVPKLVPPNTYSNSTDISPEEKNMLSELSKMIDPINASWADDGCLHRFLRATKWDVAKAAARIDNTGKWRREFGPDSILPEHVENVAEAGRQFLSGFDKEGRPIWYMIPARKSANHSVDDQIKFVVYTIEKAISLMPENVESLVIIIDYSDMSIFNAPSSGTGRKFLHILSEYYPERLGLAFIVNPVF